MSDEPTSTETLMGPDEPYTKKGRKYTQPGWVYWTFPAMWWAANFAGSLAGLSDYFFVDLLQLDSGVYALIFLIFGIINAINGPLIAQYVEKEHKWTRTRGRRKPFIRIFAPIAPIIFVATFFIPGPAVIGGDWGTGFLLLIVLVFQDSVNDLGATALQSLVPEKFKTDNDRERLYRIYYPVVYVLSIIGQFTGIVLVMMQGMFGTITGYQVTAIIGLAINIIGYLISRPAFKDPKDYLQMMDKQAPQPSLWKELVTLSKMRNFWVFILYGVCNIMFFTLMAGTIPFFVKYVLGGTEADVGFFFAIMGGGFYVGAVLGNFIWGAMLKKISYVKVFYIANAVMSTAAVVMFLLVQFGIGTLASFLFTLLPTAFVMGIGYGHGQVIGNMEMELADEYALITKRRSRSMITTFSGMVNRVARELQNVILWLVIIITGFNPAEAEQTSNAKFGILLQETIFPAIFGFLGIVVFWLIWDMNRVKRGKIKAELAELGL